MKLVPITTESPKSDEIQSDDPAIRDVIDGTRQMYSTTNYKPPWMGYLASFEGEWVGTCAFKSVPQANRVEIAYFTFPKFEGRGIATKMAESLLAIADKESPSVIITAQTMPTHNASTRILEKLGFARTRDYAHPEDGLVWEWERTNMPNKTDRGNG